MASLWPARLLFSVVNLNFLYAKTNMEKSCNELNSTTFASRYFQSSCITLSNQLGNTYDQAKVSCTQFSNGHLVLPSNRAMHDVLNSMMTQAGNDFRVGLRQKATGLEPDSDWYWQTTDEEILSNINVTNWNSPGEPNNYNDVEDCAIWHSGYINDVDCSRTDYRTACQYRDTRVLFKGLGNNKRGTNETLVRQQTSSHIGNCAIECAECPFCNAYSYSSTTKECAMYLNADATVQEQGYHMYTII